VTETAAGLRERKKDATRRALVEAARDLVADRGYHQVTIADITDAAGVSRRTFSNYFAGKAECVAAAGPALAADLLDRVRAADPAMPLDELVRSALREVAAQLGSAPGAALLMVPDEPELQAAEQQADEEVGEHVAQLVAERVGLDLQDLRVELVVQFALMACRRAAQRWLAAGRPDGTDGLVRLLDLSFSLIDLTALQRAGGRPDRPR
jgi:AcrR family transcriptional regulator